MRERNLPSESGFKTKVNPHGCFPAKSARFLAQRRFGAACLLSARAAGLLSAWQWEGNYRSAEEVAAGLAGSPVTLTAWQRGAEPLPGRPKAQLSFPLRKRRTRLPLAGAELCIQRVSGRACSATKKKPSPVLTYVLDSSLKCRPATLSNTRLVSFHSYSFP